MTTIDDLYRQIPPITCKGLCHRSCGIILLQQAELDRIVDAAGPVPVKRTPPGGLEGHQHDDTLTCPLLVRRRCSVYALRPLICRLWGVVKGVHGMRCPHGCRPKRWLSDAEARALIDQARALSPTRSLFADMDQIVR